MLTKLLIYKTKSTIYSFAYCGGDLCFVTQEEEGELASEAICRVTISRLNHGRATAFINYGGKEAGFINLPAQHKLQDGSQLIAQLVWRGNGDKVAKFKPGWSLAGKYVVYTGAEDTKLARRAASCLPEPLQALARRYPGQWLARSSLPQLNVNAELIADIELEMAWLAARAQAINFNPQHGLLEPGIPAYLNILRSLALAPDCQVISNDRVIDQMLLDYQRRWPIAAVSYDPQLAAYELVAQHAQMLHSSQVELSGGASLIFGSVAGINVIDVNSGSLDLAGDKLNFMVLDVIYQQICLRNLQGIILIDLVKNMDRSAELKILNYLKRLFQVDISKTRVLGFSKSGLCELIRNKF